MAEELEIHLGTARAGPISLLMMPLLFLATAHHLVASGQWWPIASGKILCQTRARLHSLLVIKRATAAASSSLLGWGCKWELRNCNEFSLSSLQPVENGFMHNITFSFCANFVCLYFENIFFQLNSETILHTELKIKRVSSNLSFLIWCHLTVFL